MQNRNVRPRMTPFGQQPQQGMDLGHPPADDRRGPQTWVTSQKRVNQNHQYAWAIESRNTTHEPYNLSWTCQRCNAYYALYIVCQQQQLQQQLQGERITYEIAVRMGGQTAWFWPGICQECETSWIPIRQ